MRPPLWDRLASFARRLDRRLFPFVSGLGAGMILMIVLVVTSRDPGRAWGQLWEPVGLPAWLLVAALIFTLTLGRRRRED